MALDNKYRVHEVAKDFGVSTKEITEILTKYRSAPKNHMQVLDDTDLSVIFEYLTQHNQVSRHGRYAERTGCIPQEAGAVQGRKPNSRPSPRERSLSCQQQPTQSKVKQCSPH